jgi:membrane protein implicated in regulation of membrane protease activity
MGMIWIWLGAIVLFGIAEAVTAGLVSIWFVAGGVVALIAAVLNASILVQTVLFVAVSGVTLAVTRPLAKRFTRRDRIATNADRVLGEEARVTEAVDNANSTGAVYVDGKVWTARSTDGSVIPPGAQVLVRRIEGVKLYVETIKETEAMQ